MNELGKNLWIWGHPTNSLKGVAGLTLDSDVSPLDCAKYFGADNLFYIPMGRDCDRFRLSEEMSGLGRVGWSIESPEDAAMLLEQKKQFPNISIAIFDDFFSAENSHSNYTKYTPQQLLEIRSQLHNAGIEMWVVFYTMQFDRQLGEFLSLFDGVSLWFWDEPNEKDFAEKCRRFFELTQGQKRLIGCYLYNFGKGKPADAEFVQSQLDAEYSWIKDGTIDGIILHTNAVGGMNFAAYEGAKKWVDMKSAYQN